MSNVLQNCYIIHACLKLKSKTQRRKSAKFLFLEIAEYTESNIDSVFLAFSKMTALRFCVSAFDFILKKP